MKYIMLLETTTSNKQYFIDFEYSVCKHANINAKNTGSVLHIVIFDQAFSM